MNGYKAFYNSKSIEVYAETSYAAQQLAADKMKVRKNQQHLITVMLCEKDGEQVTHMPLD